jgi:hypothetical protein
MLSSSSVVSETLPKAESNAATAIRVSRAADVKYTFPSLDKPRYE